MNLELIIPEHTIDLPISVLCAECSNELKATFRRNAIEQWVEVEPCESCITVAWHEGAESTER